MRVALCGRVAVGGGASPEVPISRPQVQLGLAILMLERHRPVALDELAHLVWGDHLSPHWQGALRGVLAKLRDAFDEAGFGRQILTTTGGIVHVTLPPDAVIDVEDARERVQQAEEAARGGQDAHARDLARDAVEILQGRFIPAVDCAWADARRSELDQLHRRAVKIFAAAEVAVGRPAEAISPLQRLLEHDPYDEGSQILLLRALAVSGERTRALAEHDGYVRRLDHDLGVPPSPALDAVRNELLQVHPPPEVEAKQVRPTLAPALPRRPAAGGPFVGRSEERDTLLAEVVRDEANVGGSRVLVIEGEQGVGKTALAARLAADADAAGVQVLWGRCSSHGSIPFEPITDALAPIFDRAGDPYDVRDLRDGLAPVLPGLGQHEAPPVGAPPGELFRAVAEVFRRVAAAPTLWVLDDLQWATADTLALLAHVAVMGQDLPLTIVCTCRDQPPVVAATLAEVGRVVPLRLCTLSGVDVAAIEQWLTESSIPLEPGLAEHIWARTGGNPLFVWHLVNAARDTGGRLDPTVIPAALDAFLGERIASLGADAGLVLAAAGVAGPSISVDVLAGVTGLPEPALLEAVDELARARLISDEGESLRFTHGLVEEAVVARVGKARKIWLHRRIAEALAASADRPGTAAEISRHYAAAGERYGDEARQWALVAASDALDQAAWAAAARHASAVLDATTAAPDDRVAALTALGRARRGLADHDGAGDALRQALDLARLHDLPRRFAEAVLHLVGGGGRGIPDHARYHRVGLIEEALARLDEVHADDDVRIPLLGALANALLLTDRDDDRRRCADDALRLARRYGDATLLAAALLDHRVALEPDQLDERAAELAEALELADGHGLPEVAISSLLYQFELALCIGDRVGAARAWYEAARRLEDHPHPYWSWALATWRVLEHVLDGDLTAAENAAAAAVASETHRADAVACYGVNLVMIRIHQGRASEIVELLERAAHDNPQIPCYRAVLSFAAAEAGDLARARDELAWFARDDLRVLPDDTNRLLAMAVLAETSVRLGDASLAPVLSEELACHGGQQVILNCYGGGGATWGPVSAHLAGLAQLAGDDAGATRWRQRARADAERIGDRLFLERLAGS